MKVMRRVKIAANFERNLEEIERFLDEYEAPRAFDALLSHLSDEVVPNLERFPTMGRSFFERTSRSVEGSMHLADLKTRAGQREIREILTGDYLLLYLDDGKTVHLLSIRHHRQLSYDLPGHWD
jgi:plasmid stabilization system protein ParE